MEHTLAEHDFPSQQGGMVDAPQRSYLPWWGNSAGRPTTPAAHYWIAALGAVIACVLLMLFHEVVRGAVKQGEVQRLAWSQLSPAYTASGGAARKAPVASVTGERGKLTLARYVPVPGDAE